MEPYIGQITMFAGIFAPKNWAFCDGQILQISDNPALYSVIGTNFGGDGRSDFALPNLQGRLAVGQGLGIGLGYYPLGASFGNNHVVLSSSELPEHSHEVSASATLADTEIPNGNTLARSTIFHNDSVPNIHLHSESISSEGYSDAHSNEMPALCVNYVIALDGIYPPRS
ncbi:tail Collar domain-containing protein [Amylibacter marinus]|uniref:Tail Collar domain-containing protein n=1 Tax=Amylibacter marinus TaxID=1475483 RepID=A0ABQ5VS73_9RHOB|nr:tail fiber protein [Amylibacter marinus]GLQ34041.1 tail Collar domain-containing protein [Amylibacter marinus]